MHTLYVYTHTRTCTHTHTTLHICIHAHPHKHPCTYMYSCSLTLRRTHPYTHAHGHTHTHKCTHLNTKIPPCKQGDFFCKWGSFGKKTLEQRLVRQKTQWCRERESPMEGRVHQSKLITIPHVCRNTTWITPLSRCG